MKERADKVLVKLGLVATRSKAALLIEEGVVYQNQKKILKASEKISEEEITIDKNTHYVGRGAHKLESAAVDFQLSFSEKILADIGASTGGFTEYALASGAKKVFAIDVGRDQLAASLRKDPRVVNLEGINIREKINLGELVDMAVVDLSFISLRLTLDSIKSLVKPTGEIVCLVKPQFEVGPQYIGNDGVVKDRELHFKMLKELSNWCQERNLVLTKASRCAVVGK